MINYLKERLRPIVGGMLVLVFINIYFLYLCGSRLYLSDLVYLDVILIFIGITIFIYGNVKYRAVEKIMKTNNFLTTKELKSYLSLQALSVIEQNDLYYHEEINHLSTQIQELSDYISRWSHEAKLPIASMRLMNERNQDLVLKKQMRLTIEQIQLLLNTMLTYMLDQFITNSIKYKQTEPNLTFYIREDHDGLELIVEDNGIGIAPEDAPYIFDRGFIGHNLRDGDYRSTGMGLYFVKEIAEKLGIKVIYDNTFCSGSRFKLQFEDNAEYFMLDY